MAFKKGHKINIGRKVSLETREKLSLVKSKPKIEKICICGKKFKVWPSRENRAKFCSIQCHNKSKIGRTAWNKGLIGYLSGKNHHWYGKNNSKENNPSWKGGPDFWKKDNKRNDPAYQSWRMKVWKRDDFRCVIADDNCNGRIEAHHILSWKEYVELRYNVNNGITLCHAHHPKKRAEEKRLIPQFRGIVSVLKVTI